MLAVKLIQMKEGLSGSSSPSLEAVTNGHAEVTPQMRVFLAKLETQVQILLDYSSGDECLPMTKQQISP